jgi:hypothetical protein
VILPAPEKSAHFWKNTAYKQNILSCNDYTGKQAGSFSKGLIPEIVFSMITICIKYYRMTDY